MEEKKELPSVQAKRRKDSKYLPHHSRNHSSKTQIFPFFFLLSAWMNESAVTSTTPYSPSMSGLKEAPSIPSNLLHVSTNRSTTTAL